jgi:hypothetical protein
MAASYKEALKQVKVQDAIVTGTSSVSEKLNR